MDKPFFSVIVTTYNRENTIKRALESILIQSDNSWEAIIVDDGSKDKTREKIEKYLDDKRFKYVYHENQGAGFSKNRGLMIAEGNFVTFLDSDDEYLKDHLSSRKEILLSNDTIDLLYGGCKIIGNPYVPDINDKSKMIHLSNCIIGGTMFIRRSKAIEIGGFKALRFGDDTEFFNRSQHFGLNIMKTSIETYIYHRDSSDSLCGVSGKV